MLVRLIRRLGTAAVLVGLPLFAGQAAAQFVWTGTTSGNWSDVTKWQGGTVPVSGSTTTISFGDGSYTATDDIANPFTLNGLTFTNTGTGASGVTIAGGTLNFAGTNPTITKGTGDATISAPITLGANLTTAGGAGTLTLTGGVNDNSGGFNLIKTSTGPLTFAGSASSSFKQLSIQNGAVNVTGGTVMLTNPNGTGGPNNVANGTSGLQLGAASGQTGSLTISGGATVSVTDNVFAGDAAGSTGTITVTGAGSVLTNTANGGASNRIAIGQFGTGTLNVTAGGVVNTALLYVARNANTNGTVVLDGTGSQINLNPAAIGVSQLLIAGGANSVGTFTASNGASVFVGGGGNSFIGNGANATATVTFSSGATLNNTTGLLCGNPLGATANLTFTGTGTSLTVGGNLWLGSNTAGPSGTATLNILNGATASVAAFALGNNITGGSGGNGTINVSGAGSTFNGTGTNTIAFNPGSVGAFNVTNGGTATLTGTTFLGLAGASGATPGGAGTIGVSGTGSSLTITGQLIAGGGNSPGGTGVVTVSNNGTMTVSGGSTIGQDIGTSGTLNVTSGGTYNGLGGFIVGGTANAAPPPPSAIGTVNVDGPGSTLTTTQIILGGGFTGTAGGNGVMNVTRRRPGDHQFHDRRRSRYDDHRHRHVDRQRGDRGG